MLIAVIIGCTLLIIVCLGGGRKLAQIILGAAGVIGALILFGPGDSTAHPTVPTPAAIGLLVAFAAFVGLMVLRRRGVNLNITHMRHHERATPTDEPH